MILKYFTTEDGDKVVYSGSTFHGTAMPVATFCDEGDAIKFIDSASAALNDSPMRDFKAIRRERIAIAAMQGLLSSDKYFSKSTNLVVELAVEQADALIAELDKTDK